MKIGMPAFQDKVEIFISNLKQYSFLIYIYINNMCKIVYTDYITLAFKGMEIKDICRKIYGL